MPNADRRPAARPPARRARAARTVRTGVAALVVAGVATGCLTGQRPTLVERPVVDDPAAQAVLDRLGTVPSVEFTATYQITPTQSDEATTATVVQSGTRRRVTIGDVDYLTDGTSTRTCSNDDRGCVDFLDDARVSDLNVTHRFWGDAFATRLELDASRRIAFSEPSSETIAGAPAGCVTIKVPSSSSLPGSVEYCALDAGPLARYLGADVRIELVEFVLSADPAVFGP